jgi:NAD(P)-dependent dehydrogenase (short-subunit alcohol dehydrogenase family)
MTGPKLVDQVWIVTGAASGIGRAIARLFASQGARVVIADVTQEVIEGGIPTVDMIAADGGKAVYLPTDVSQREQVDATVAETVSRYGRLDGIVNNACIRHARSLLEMEERDWERVLRVNLTGTYLCCRAAVGQMIGASWRGPRADRQSVFATRNDCCAGRHCLWHDEGGDCLPDQTDCGRLRRQGHRL